MTSINASTSVSISRRPAFLILVPLALLALLTASLLLLLPGGSAQAQAAAITLDYDENGTGPVFTFAARDPEGVVPPTIWSVVTSPPPAGIPDDEVVAIGDVEDVDDFSISADGVLTFNSAPDYEEPDDETGGTRNEYHVTVQASDGGVTEHLSWYKVVVTVRDVEEQGMVTWMVDPDGAADVDVTGIPQPFLQFQAGATLTASVTDDDGDIAASLTWKWYRASSMSGPWSEVPGEILPTYNVKDTSDDNDEGMYLRVVATYTDRRGARNTAEFVSENPVQISREDNTAPVFGGSATRTMDENSRENIGAPVTATDVDNDILTYSFDSTSPDVGPDSDSFDIDRVTGQLKAKAGLDFEMPAADVVDNQYVVTVRATDSKGSTDTADVTITVRDVNEAPTVIGEGMANDHAEDAAVALMTGPVDGGQPWMATATDPEGGSITWSLSGADEALFELTETGDAPSMRGLVFKAKPNFEDPGDANGDNIYEVTVVASDGSDNSAERSVTVKVTDRDETGKVELSTQNPVVGVEITATPIDSDTYVNNVTWVWHRLEERVEAGAELSPLPDPNTDMLGPISGARSNMYTPMAADVGWHLVAVVSYLDRTFDENNEPNDNFVGFENEVRSEVTTKVLASPTNQPPEFREGSSAVRLVAENTVPVADSANGNLGDLVEATDPDGENDDLSYALDGEDKASFELMPLMGNQLRVRPGTMLNYETKDTYTVVLMAKDGSGQANDTASITVTIMVVDLDEEPEISQAGLMVAGRKSIIYNENSTVDVESYTSLGPDAGMATWTLAGDDSGDLNITEDGGELRFNSPPNYEMPSDDDGNGVYMVTVVASDGTNTAMMDVAVTVANVDEPGAITLNPDNPGIGSVISATVEDPDGATSNVVWGWQRSVDREIGWNSIPGGSSNTYTLVAADGGHYLRAVATYTDPEGTGKRAEEATTGAATIRPTFPGDTTSRVVPENSAVGTAVGEPVTAAATGNYRLGGADAASFAIDGSTGQITVSASAALDYETKDSYTVNVTASDTAGFSDEITVTISVTNVDEDGAVILSTQPVVGIELTASVDDPDGDVTATWQWARSATPDGNYTDIEGAGAMEAAYTPTMNDKGMYLQATATYDDGVGDPDSAMMVSEPVVTVTLPMFDDGVDTEISVAENTAAGAIGNPFTATDADGGAPVYSLASGTDASFSIDAASGQLSTTAELDYETAMTYMVTVEVRDNEDDSGASDTAVDATHGVTVTVTNVDEDGTVTLSSTKPRVGTALTASLTDPDGVTAGSVTWQWASSNAMNGAYSDISGATSDSYTPEIGDENMYLRAMASYTDGEDSGKTAEGVSANAVLGATAAPTTGSEVGDRYDTNPKDGEINGPEIIEAVRDYFAKNITGSEVIEVVRLYFVSR